MRKTLAVEANAQAEGPVLLCYDGSEDARVAISRAGELLAPGPAVVLTVWEPVSSWEPYDPATILSAPLSRLASNALDIDDIVHDVGRERLADGADRAVRAGFTAEGRLNAGKPWRTICKVAKELDAAVIVLGARGLGGVASALLGSVSTAVVHHAGRPVLVIPSPED